MCRANLTLPVVIVVFLLVGTFQAQARPVSPYSPQRIADEAEVIVVGEVVEVTEAGRIPAEQTQWNAALLDMRAQVRVLRVYPHTEETKPAGGDLITVPYLAIDWENTRGLINGPFFTEFRAGDVYAFPLRRANGQPEAGWKLIAEEDNGLLVPCAKEAIEAPRDTGVEFLQAELAAAFAQGRYSDVYKAGKYLHELGSGYRTWPLYILIARHVGNDEARWLDIAVATCCAMPMPRPTIEQLRQGQGLRRPQGILASRVLRRVSDHNLDDRIIATAIEHAAVHQWGTGVLLSQNYRRHPTAVRLLTEALQARRPEAVYVAQSIIKEADHPLVPPAVRAAIRVLRAEEAVEFNNLRAACELIRDYGDEGDFDILLEEIEAAQTTDRDRYKRLWQSCAYVKNQRLIRIIRLVIEDRHPFSEKLRFCDLAGFELQRVTDVDFGLSSGQSAEEHEQALARARAWLAENPD